MSRSLWGRTVLSWMHKRSLLQTKNSFQSELLIKLRLKVPPAISTCVPDIPHCRALVRKDPCCSSDIPMFVCKSLVLVSIYCPGTELKKKLGYCVWTRIVWLKQRSTELARSMSLRWSTNLQSRSKLPQAWVCGKPLQADSMRSPSASRAGRTSIERYRMCSRGSACSHHCPESGNSRIFDFLCNDWSHNWEIRLIVRNSFTW